MQRIAWLALSYTVPINPSKARVYVWRKLRELGAEYLRQGMAVLPNSAVSLQRFRALALKIRQMDGEASILELRFVDAADETEMTSRFQKQVDAEYRALISDCTAALGQLQGARLLVSAQESERMRRMVKKYRKTKARDYFGSGAAREIEEGLNELVDSVREVAGDISKQLRSLLDA